MDLKSGPNKKRRPSGNAENLAVWSRIRFKGEDMDFLSRAAQTLCSEACRSGLFQNWVQVGFYSVVSTI